MASSSSSLESEALKRKERLMMMKRKAATTQSDAKEENENSAAESAKKPTFRSYNPADDSLKKDGNVIPPTEPADVEEQVKDQIESAKETTIASEIDLATLAPRKIDWDLKRDVENKLRKLERRTQQAIADLIRERLASGKQDLLLSAVDSGAKAAEERHFSDDDD